MNSFQFTRQLNDNDCATACLSMILKYYGKKCSMSKLYELTGTIKTGTSVYGVLCAAQRLGFDSKAVRARFIDYLNELTLPCIASVHVKNRKHFESHYIVIYRIKDNECVIADPLEGIKRIKLVSDKGPLCDVERKYIFNNIFILLVPSVNFKNIEAEYNRISLFHNIKTNSKNILKIYPKVLLFISFNAITAVFFDVLYKNAQVTWGIPTILFGSVVVLLSQFAGLWRRLLKTQLSQRINNQTTINYHSHIRKLPIEFFEARRASEICCNFDLIPEVCCSISEAILVLVYDIPQVLLFSLLLFRVNCLIAILFVVLFLTKLLLMYGIDSLFLRSCNDCCNVVSDNSIYRAINNILQIKIEPYNDLIYKWMCNKILQEQEIEIRKLTYNEKHNQINRLVNLIMVGAFGVGYMSLCKGDILSLSYILLLVCFSGESLENVSSFRAKLQYANNRTEEIFSVDELERENNTGKNIICRINTGIIISKVSFEYKNQKAFIEDITLQIQCGDVVALVGKSGSGKTTLAKLLMKLIIPTQGEILIDGHSISEINTPSLHARMKYLPQEAYIPEGSINDIFSLGSEYASPIEIIHALHTAGIYEFIYDLPNKFDTDIQRDGIILSPKQRQQLAIARAIMQSADVYIFDEAIVDGIGSGIITQIQLFFKRKGRNPAIIIISNRQDLVEKADNIFVLDNGRIVEEGAYHKLIDQENTFSRLLGMGVIY